MKFDLQNMLQQAQKMQSEFEGIKKELDNKFVTADSGGGMVIAKMTASQKLVSIKIAPELVKNDDITMLEDLIVAAINKASKEASELASNEMSKVQSMIPNIPGLNLGL